MSPSIDAFLDSDGEGGNVGIECKANDCSEIQLECAKIEYKKKMRIFVRIQYLLLPLAKIRP